MWNEKPKIVINHRIELFTWILFGMLRAGGMSMTRSTKVPLDISLIIQSLVIILVAAPSFIKFVILRRKN
jgi:ABC-type uncharacterized transport system permease subunit